jgi:hypothetical protein
MPAPSTTARARSPHDRIDELKVPANIETGLSTLYVVANGIASAGTAVTVTAGAGCVLVVETHDFNGDCNSDILWRNANSGGVALWFMSSNSILISGTTPSGAG